MFSQISKVCGQDSGGTDLTFMEHASKIYEASMRRICSFGAAASERLDSMESIP